MHGWLEWLGREWTVGSGGAALAAEARPTDGVVREAAGFAAWDEVRGDAEENGEESEGVTGPAKAHPS